MKAATTYTTSELFTLANQLRKNGLTQKEAFAEAKKQLETPKQEKISNETGRGKYTRDENWKANHSVKMKLRWAIRHETETFKKREPNGLRGKYTRDENWKANHAAKMREYWQARKEAKEMAAEA